MGATLKTDKKEKSDNPEYDAQYDAQYDAMNAGAHRRPPPGIAAPALVWQRGFWHPPGLSQEKWTDIIDAMLAHLFLYLRNDATLRTEEDDTTSPAGADDKRPPPASATTRTKLVCSNLECDLEHKGIETLFLFRNKVSFKIDGTECRFLTDKENKYLKLLRDAERSIRHEVFSLEVKWGDVKLVVYAQLHKEYFSVMFAIDFSERSEWTDALRAKSRLEKIGESLSKIQALIVKRANEYDKNNPYVVKIADDEQKLINTIPRKIVLNMKRWINGLCSAALSPRSLQSDLGSAQCGAMFIDSFGIIYGVKHCGEKPTFFPIDPTLKSPRLTVPALVRGCDLKEGREALIEAVWPIARSVNKGQPRPPHIGKPEISVTFLQRRSALYLTSLGRLIPGSQRCSPIIYSLVVSYVGRWRLGRLIDRLHSLETLRIVALRDLDAINNASRSISLLDRHIHDASVRGDLRRYRNEELIGRFDRVEKDAGIDLTYRIARSRYYVACYRDLANMMGLETEAVRVEGFQPYGNFVRRRLFDCFAYIDRVGVRYLELRKRIAFIIESNEQQSMTDLVKAARNNTATTNKLLGAAELFSIPPITYYIGETLHHALGFTVEPDSVWYSIGLALALSFAGVSHFLIRHR